MSQNISSVVISKIKIKKRGPERKLRRTPRIMQLGVLLRFDTVTRDSPKLYEHLVLPSFYI
jgi:hypothetical protein